LRFARLFHGEKFRFLTLTSKIECEESARDRKRRLFRGLRVEISGLEYRCTRTDEGNGVCHLCLVSPVYIPWKKIEELWGARVNITQERDLEALLKEMSLQSDHCQYSMSRRFLPNGAIEAIETLGRHFRGTLGRKCIEMLARRYKRDNPLHKTLECCMRKDGWHSRLDNHMENLGGRI
jgi:hypothetical protein